MKKLKKQAQKDLKLKKITYDLDKELDRLLNSLLKNQCILRDLEEMSNEVEFDNGWSIEFWNGSKYGGWLQEGHIHDTKGNIIHRWRGKQPSLVTMNRFRQALVHFHHTQEKEVQKQHQTTQFLDSLQEHADFLEKYNPAHRNFLF